MKLKKVLLLILFLFPVVVCGLETEDLETPVSLGFGQLAESWLITSPKQYYSINGQMAFCMDQGTPNPKLLRQRTVFTVGKDNFGDGLIAMMNFNLSRNYNAGLYDAIRIFMTESGYANRAPGQTSSALGGSNHSKAVREFLDVAYAAYNGDTKYLPIASGGSDMEDNFSLEVIDDSNLNNIKVRINFNSAKPSNFKMSSKCTTSNSNYSCSIVSGLNSNNEFSFSLKGKSNAGGNIVVKFNFGNSSAGGEMYDRVYIYGCSGSNSACLAKDEFQATYGWQRFVTVDDGDLIDGGTGSGSGGITKEVRITVPGICDDPNLSQDELLENGCCDKIKGKDLEDNSKAQDTYIKYCGPIAYAETKCGSETCDDGNYEDFSHSYVKLRNMNFIIEDLKANSDLSGLDDYLDYSVVAGYCDVYTTEKLDILTPATAASVSGQFFVFDSYNSTNYGNINAYFRQPYIVERVKSTLFFNYKKWKSNYENAIEKEKQTYDEWQTAVKNVKASFDEWQRLKNNISKAQENRDAWYNPPNRSPFNVCVSTSNSYNRENCIEKQGEAKSSYDSAVSEASDAYTRYIQYKDAEPGKRSAYKSALSARMGLQDTRNTCVEAINNFASSHNFNFDNDKPNVDFTYSQTSQKEGKTTTTINMVDNTSPVKYWPNTTTDSSNTYYQGIIRDNPGGKFEITRTGNTVGTCDDNSCTLNNYTLGSSSSIDNCSSTTCTSYSYDGTSHSSIQGKTSADDPYDQDISLTTDETISKIYFFRPPNNTFALMNSGEYKTLNYEANAAHSDMNGLEVGYVYNIELTTYKGTYDTSFSVSNYGYKIRKGKENLIQNLLKKFDMEGDFNLNDSLTSKCVYCNMEMAFRRNCDICDPDDPTTYDFEPQFYYRSISLSDVTPNEREGETNWTDAKGNAAKTQIELGSGIANSDTVKNNNEYVALANGNDYSKDGKISTYLADSSNVGKHDIYDDGTREYLEYEVTLTTKDLQMIKRNSSRSYFNYAKMNMCAGDPKNVKDADEQYCFKCNSDMKECESSFVTSFFSDTTGRSKWKYYVNGQYCVGNIKTCIKGLDYTMVDSKGQVVSNLDGIYPDPLFPKQFLERYKNWP